MSILGMGCIAVDDVLYVDAYPAPDEKVQVRRQVRRCGGQTGNALIAAARLGANCAYAGILGDDPLSVFVRNSLEREGIDLSAVKIEPGARPIHCTIIVDMTDGTRTVFYDLEGAHPLPQGWDPENPVSRANCLLVDQFGIEGILEAVTIAGLQETPIVGGFERADQPRFDEVLWWTDHLILDRGFALKLTGASDAPTAVMKLWPRAGELRSRGAVIVTCGREGCWYRGRGGPETPVHMPAFPVKTLDSVGCGDVFRGAYAAELLREVEVEEGVRFASAAAALKAQNDYSPTRAEVDEFLKKGASIH